MAIRTVNPATDEVLEEFEPWDEARIDRALSETAEAAPGWAARPVAERAAVFPRVAERLRERADEFAELITREMGKPVAQARAEVDKCARVCDFYAEEGPGFLADDEIQSAGSKSLVRYQPLGTVFGIMPWNFPFWQVFRFAVPSLVAGNTALLKHAPNVAGCARAIESVMREGGVPEGVFINLVMEVEHAERVIRDPRVHAVTLTGSGAAGRKVAAQAGDALKKTVLELGGSDPFIVLEDADLDAAAEWGVKSRFQANGQSCIAAKRFIVTEPVADDFLERLRDRVEALKVGDPMDENNDLGPLARPDLLQNLEDQVKRALDAGATAVTGCEAIPGTGNFYPPSIIEGLRPEMPVWNEEMFGPVASVIRARDEDEAVALANDTPFGLGGSVWTKDTDRGEAVANRLASGSAFVNSMVKSDPRLPFGGIKESGYGRELSRLGIHEFVNAKTVFIA